jgi:hypothetical protein
MLAGEVAHQEGVRTVLAAQAEGLLVFVGDPPQLPPTRVGVAVAVVLAQAAVVDRVL